MKHKLDLKERVLDDEVKKICHCHWIDLCNSEKGDKKECELCAVDERDEKMMNVCYETDDGYNIKNEQKRIL